MNSHKNKMIAPIIVTAVILLYYIVYFGLLMAVLDGIWIWLFGGFPILFGVVMVKVCIERIKEIKKGEEDDLSKY